MTDAPQLPNKKDVTRSFLLRGTVFLHLDPRKDGVVVPEWLRKQPQLVLQIGLDMPIQIPDLRVDDTGVTGSLSFNRSPCLCAVAWDAVFAVVGEDGRGMVWPESMPSEIAAEVERESRRNRLQDATIPGATEPGQSDRPRSSAPATPLEAIRSAPTLAAAPMRSEKTSSDAANSKPPTALGKSRKPATPAVEAEPAARRSTPPKPVSGSAKRPGKRPLPPYLRIVK